jgi:hypothetical protein
MARRKKQAKKSSPRRRRSMGAISSGAGMAVYAVAGAAAAQLLSKVLPSTLDDKIKAAAPLALGFFLPKFVKGPVGQGLGAGMVAVGGLKLVQSFGVLNGIGEISSNVNYSAPLIGASYNRSGLVDKSFATPAIAGMDELGC